MKHQPTTGDRFRRLIATDFMAGLHAKKKKRAAGGSVHEHIAEQAKVVNVNPTEAQKQAGNYRKGHIKVHGLDITIENPRGSTRSGMSDGKRWTSRLPHHYGYVRRTEGGDGDHVDVFVGPHLKAPTVYVIDQHHPESGDWDEHKCMIGFGSRTQAEEAYKAAFSDKKGQRRIGHVEAMGIEKFKGWLKGDTTTAVRRHRADGGGVSGMLAPGNIDLHNRPIVENPDGGYSTVRSISANMGDGRETLMPTVYGQSILSDTDAERLYRMSGKHLGQFDTPDNADAYAQSLHNDQDREYGGRRGYAEGGAPSFDQTSEVPSFDQTEPAVDNGKMDAVLRGAAQGATFNFADEIAGAHAAGPSWVPEMVGPVPARTIAGAARTGFNKLRGEETPEYDKGRDEFRAADKQAKAAHPYLHTAGEFAGMIPSMAVVPEAGFVARLGQGAGKLARYGAGAADVATQGGISGGIAGAGEGEDIGSRALESAKGIVSGVVGGGLAHGVSEIGKAAFDKFGKPILNTIQGWRNPNGEAARRVVGGLRNDQEMIQRGEVQGLTPQQWEQARTNGEPVTLADMGAGNTQSLLRSSANTSPAARSILENTFEGRFHGQTERVGDTVRNLLPGGQSNARKTGDQLVAEYDQARIPAYKKSYEQGDRPIMSPAMERLMSSDTFVAAMKRAISSGKDRDIEMGLGGFNPMVNVTPDGRIVFNKGAQGVPTYPNLQYWDQVKRELDSAASQAKRSGDTVGGPAALARVLRGELDAQVPSYAKARGVAETYFGESNALEAGRAIAGKKPVAADVATILRKMDPHERELFKEGYASDLTERVIGRMKDTQDVTKAMFNSPNERQLAAAIFGPGGVAMLRSRMALETIMNGARNALGNSTTARQLIEAGLAGGAINGYQNGWDPTQMVLGAGAFASARGAPKFFAPQAVAGIKNFVGKVDAKTARRVAELLTSDDPRLLNEGYRMAAQSRAIGDGLLNIARKVALAGQAQGRQPVSDIVKSISGPATGRAEDSDQRPKVRVPVPVDNGASDQQ